MSKREISIPTNIEDLMQIYINYEDSQKRKGPFDTPDFLQSSAYGSDPMTSFHKKYYSSKYRAAHYWLMLSCFIMSIVFYVLYFIGFYLVLNLYRIIIFFIAFSYSIFISVIVPRMALNKWNWKYPSMLIPLSMGIIFAILSFFNSESVEEALFTLCGISLGPACLMIYLSYRNYSYITDYGGIHLHLGWIYRIAQTNGDLKVLNYSFTRMIEDLDMWLITTSKVTLKNKRIIFQNFFLNVISNRNFLVDISRGFKDDIQSIFKGLLVEELLHSELFSHVNEKDKKIPNLNRTDLRYLRYRLALIQLPRVIELIEKLTSIKVNIKIYSTMDMFKKIWSKILAAIIFLVSSLIPLILKIM